MYTATFTKNGNVFTVTYMSRTGEMSVAVTAGGKVSPHLAFDSSYTERTSKEYSKLAMIPVKNSNGALYVSGDCYVIQLKNGHFLVCDGGTSYNLDDMIAYMEANKPAEDEKPVIEGWFVTHTHWDHVSWAASASKVAEQLAVEGVYYNAVNSSVIANTCWKNVNDAGTIKKIENNPWQNNLVNATKNLRNSEGTQTPLYRPQTGQKYYFCDITVDVVYTQEQVMPEQYSYDLNAASSWYLFNINGQTFLEAGDTEQTNMDDVKAMYSSDFVLFGDKLDVVSAFHHGVNLTEQNVIDKAFLGKTMLYSRNDISAVTASGLHSLAKDYGRANYRIKTDSTKQRFDYSQGIVEIEFHNTGHSVNVLSQQNTLNKLRR